MPEPSIRPISIGVVRRGGDLLVCKGVDDGVEFFRPLGGGIEFGESAEAALRREFAEELAAELAEVRLLGVLESRFLYNGVPGHEIVFAFTAALTGTGAGLPAVVVDTGEAISWEPVDTFRRGAAHLYPVGLIELLE